MKTFAEIVENQRPDEWHAHILCLGKAASAAFAGCETGPLVHVHLVRERHYLLGPGSGRKPLWFPDTSLLLAVIDRDESEPDKWLERFRLTFNASPLVLITMRAKTPLMERVGDRASEFQTSWRPASQWHFTENSGSPEIIARFIALAATPLEFGTTTLVCVDFADYLSALDGGWSDSHGFRERARLRSGRGHLGGCREPAARHWCFAGRGVRRSSYYRNQSAERLSH